ncbi:MAG: S-layer protein domain-containing protein, partial [Methanothrix sp.]
RTFTSGTPLKLADGYELVIKSVDVDGNKVNVELMKDGISIESRIISPSKTGATMSDQTYVYKKNVGDTEKLVIIGVHFKNAFRGADQDIATVKGIFQVSDQPMDVSVDTEYDKMRISKVDDKSIEMDNKDNAITLNKNKDIALMAGIHIKTADQDVIDADNPLRFYIYKEATIEGAAPAPVEAKPAVEEKPVVEEKKVEEAAPVNVTEEKPAVEEKKVEEHAAPAAPAEEKKAEEKGAPGFEAVFAVTGLLAVAYLVSRRN